MEANKVYIDSINTLANIIKTEQLRTKLLEDNQLKENYIHIIDNLLLLEIDHNCLFENKKMSALFGKALVNICKEKIKFEKPENKTIDDAFGDVMFLQTYCLNTYKISRESLSSTSLINEEVIKDYQKITDEMKQKYLESNTAQEEPEVVNPSEEQPNTSSKSTNANNSGQTGTGFNKNWNQNPFLQGNVPIHPLQDPRFYPYNSKPKYMKWIRLGLGILMALMSIFYIVITIFVSTNKGLIGYKIDWDGWENEFNNYFGEWKFPSRDGEEAKHLVGYWFLGSSIGIRPTSAGSIFIMILMALLMAWMVYTILQKPKRYKDQFMISGMTLFVPIMFIISIFITFIGAIQWLFGVDIPYNNLATSLYASFHPGQKLTSDAVNKWLSENPDYPNQIRDVLNYLELHLNYDAAKGLVATMFAVLILSLIAVIAVLFVNPRMDREKVAYANEEYQKMVAAAMQGQSYQIDPNIYESEQEIQDFIDYVKGNNKKTNKDKGDNQYH